jgi:hypothetical protein
VRRRLILLPLLIIVYAARTAAAQTACDRACLARVADEYFAAMVAHDPSKAPLAKDVRFTEQTQVKAIGDGLWKTASEGPTSFKIYVPDPVVGQIGGIVMMKDAGKPIQVAVRLEVQNRQIVEAEHLIWTNVNANTLANLQTPRPGLLATVPPAERLPREVCSCTRTATMTPSNRATAKRCRLPTTASGVRAVFIRPDRERRRLVRGRRLHRRAEKDRQHRDRGWGA